MLGLFRATQLPAMFELVLAILSRDLTGRLNGAQPNGSSDTDITKLSRDFTPCIPEKNLVKRLPVQEKSVRRLGTEI